MTVTWLEEGPHTPGPGRLPPTWRSRWECSGRQKRGPWAELCTAAFLTTPGLVVVENGQALAGVAQLVGASSCEPKGRGFNPWSGHTPRLWVRSPVRAHTRGNQSMFPTHVEGSLPPFPSKINERVLG